MVVINIGHTSLVNPPESRPVITHAQLWSAMQRKIRYAQEFVPIIASCEVISEEADPAGGDAKVVTRDVVFKDGQGAKDQGGKPLREVVKSYYPAKVDFHQPDGAVVQNCITIGTDADGTEMLYLSYMFEYRFPELESGGEEAKKREKHLKQVSEMPFYVFDFHGSLFYHTSKSKGPRPEFIELALYKINCCFPMANQT